MERWVHLLRQIGAITWHRRWLLIATAWGVCLLGWTAVWFVPNSYESEARLYVDTDAILTPLLHGLAVDTATASQLEFMQRTLLSRPNLDKLIASTELETGVTTPQMKEALVAGLGKAIKVNGEAHNLFTVSYRNTNPRLARDVVAALVNIFMERATGSDRTDMDNAQRFLNEQISSYENQLRAAEQRRADFRRKYLDILPLESNGGISRLDSARANVRDLETQLRDATAQRTSLQQEAQNTPPLLPRGGIAGTGAAGGLAEAEEKLAELRTRYTEEHPDVISARKLVESLKSQALSSSSTPTTGSAGTGSLSNPVYEQIKVRLIEVEASISSLQSRLGLAHKELDQLENLARAAPEVEAENENLNRDYDVLRRNYEELLARREASKITAAANTGADEVRMRVIDPPQISVIPVSPNRLMLDSAVFLAGICSAIGLAILLYQTDRSIQNLGGLGELGFPVLGGISMISTVHRKVMSMQIASVATAMFILIVLYGGLAIHHIG